jgi:transposase
MATNGAARAYKRWPEALKREIIAATLAPGASVSVVARQYDVNANQVFSWRRRYLGAEQPAAPASSTSRLVPVTITHLDEGASPPAPTTSETTEIEVAGDYRVRVGSGLHGSPTSSPASPAIPSPGSTICCPGTGDLTALPSAAPLKNTAPAVFS